MQSWLAVNLGLSKDHPSWTTALSASSFWEYRYGDHVQHKLFSCCDSLVTVSTCTFFFWQHTMPLSFWKFKMLSSLDLMIPRGKDSYPWDGILVPYQSGGNNGYALEWPTQSSVLDHELQKKWNLLFLLTNTQHFPVKGGTKNILNK